MTPARKKLLEQFILFEKENSYYPSGYQLAKFSGFSKTNVYYHLHSLVQDKILVRNINKKASYALADTAKDLMRSA